MSYQSTARPARSKPDPARVPANPESFDLTALTGCKPFRLDRAWDQRFGTLSTTGEQPRLVQFSARFRF